MKITKRLTETFTLVAILGILLCMTACGKSKPATEVEKLITSIGTVTIDSEASIVAAEEYYDTLTNTQKDEVENYKILVDARNQYDELVTIENAKNTAKEIDDQIAYLLSQKVRSQAEIDELLSKYDSLTESQKEYVTSADQIDAVLELTENEKIAVAAVKALKNSLKNEASMKLESISVATGTSTATSKYYAYITYSATNSFGGTLDSSVTIDITGNYSAGFWGLSRLLGSTDKISLQLYNDYLNHSTDKIDIDCDRVLNNLDATL